MRPFESLTIFLLATNETDALRRTLNGVLENCSYEDIEKIVIFLKSKDCPSAFTAQEIINERVCDKIEIAVQKYSQSADAFSEIPLLATGSHFVIMASDGEMAPESLKDFVRIAKEKPEAIICGAKWNEESTVENHALYRTFGSRFLDMFAAFLFGRKDTDLFSIFQIYPVELYKKMNFNGKKLLYEYTLKPLRFGTEYIEIPTTYRKEAERKATATTSQLIVIAIKYCWNVLRIRFTPKRYL
jgi:hypothetical protein